MAPQDPGYRMKKGTLVIDGGVQGPLGTKMRGGKIVVHGDVGKELPKPSTEPLMNLSDPACQMKKGTLAIKGDVPGSLGTCMQGGKIIVHGDVGSQQDSTLQKGAITIDQPGSGTKPKN